MVTKRQNDAKEKLFDLYVCNPGLKPLKIDL